MRKWDSLTFLFWSIDAAVYLEEQLNDEMEEHESQKHPGQPPRNVCLRQAQSDEQGRGCGYVEMWMVNKYKKVFKKNKTLSKM